MHSRLTALVHLRRCSAAQMHAVDLVLPVRSCLNRRCGADLSASRKNTNITLHTARCTPPQHLDVGPASTDERTKGPYFPYPRGGNLPVLRSPTSAANTLK